MTKHLLINDNSSSMIHNIETGTVNLVVTSPPYPMIEMWDDIFSQQDDKIGLALSEGDGITAFNRMHDILDKVWSECDRVLANNGFVCINIGDATRTINDSFQLYSNHTRIIQFFLNRGYTVLPDIHWRKQSNSPNKFMGSGMYPAGAYVTYEHEYILIFRKGNKRIFKGEEKLRRQKSAYFWEERNIWFSDLWDIKGTSQKILNSSSRNRSAAFPLEIPYRLINMYSVEGDTVLDPFAGLGTTTIASMISQRNSIGYEIDPEIYKISINNIPNNPTKINKIIDDRIRNHLEFINSLSQEKLNNCYDNNYHGFKVKTRQETAIKIDKIHSINSCNNTFDCDYQ